MGVSPAVPLASEAARVEKRKYPALVRTTYEAVPLGVNHWGEWLSVPRQDALLLLPFGEWWVAWFRRDGSLRVDVATEVVAGGVGTGLRSFVDLDLDVERGVDGTTVILDEDQFAERCQAYPPAWVPVARQVVVDVAGRARRREEPFDLAHGAWTVAAGWPGPGVGVAVVPLAEPLDDPARQRPVTVPLPG